MKVVLDTNVLLAAFAPREPPTGGSGRGNAPPPPRPEPPTETPPSSEPPTAKPCPDVPGTPKNVIPESRLGHIFRDAEGHLPDTPANRQLLTDVGNDPAATLGTDSFGNTWSARTLSDGTQVWVRTRNGEIINGGLNQTPRAFNPQTG